MDEALEDAINKGLMDIGREDIHEANRQYQIAKELEGTKKQEGLDIFSSYIKLYQRN